MNLTEIILFLSCTIILILFSRWALLKLKINLQRRGKLWHESFVQALISPLIYTILFFAGIILINMVGENLFSTPILENRDTWLKIGSIFFVVWFLMRWKKAIMNILVRKSKTQEIAMDPGRLDVINKMGTIALIFITFLMLLEATKSSITTLIAFGGIGGLAFAFASQEIIANFFSGAMIYLTRPFLVGDIIQVPEKKIEGTVEEIGWYMTRIRTIDKLPVYIPNSLFSKMIVITPSRMTHRLFKETFALRYEDMPKIANLMKEIKKMLSQHPEIDKDRKATAYLNTFETYSLNILISAYTKTTSADDFLQLRQELLLNIYQLIEKHGAKSAVPITYVQMCHKSDYLSK